MATLTGSRSIDAAETLDAARRVVIKIGSALLVDAASGALRRGWLEGLAADVAALKAQGKDVLLVSSGSIALGRRILGLPQRNDRLDESQAAASVGQIRLAQSYQEVLAAHGLTAAQVLVTLEDTEDRRRYLNTRATLRTLLGLGTVPIINENDTVATDEIRYGDNDRLAAQIASLSGADVLVLLSDIDGLYTANPREDAGAAHIPLVEAITPEIEGMAGGTGSAGAKGGMKTKIMAAQVAMRAGCMMAITIGDVDRPLSALRAGQSATWFRGLSDPKAARKQWISAMKPKGRIAIDAGAARALRDGKSLLPAGVTDVSGWFERGDPVEIAGPDGVVLTLGLAAYDADEASAIMGLRSQDIAARLGHPGRAALVHRDDMAI
ncbi:glutamate 5-kinase [Halovulum dunhuangense]|uniref:Glutamate 5-kinase n=1 Tax=Halovulum dunhuangense TaxID=1505036 RepID=A0A849L2N3_9RHOB|nr:glutamate 5-kinase [Halovulum dunhuangense]NNU80545.1 glutamate 5-kinase [Halovulum dunhuangense]